jgi:hypothetical protein
MFLLLLTIFHLLRRSIWEMPSRFGRGVRLTAGRVIYNALAVAALLDTPPTPVVEGRLADTNLAPTASSVAITEHSCRDRKQIGYDH